MNIENKETVHVWWVQNKPFDQETRKSNEAQEFQYDCINNNIFVMGWRRSEFDKYIGSEINTNIASELRSFVKNGGFTRAQNNFLRIKPGDIALTRLDSEYYAGVIVLTPRMSEDNKVTWYSKVDEWKHLWGKNDIPHHLRGKLSSRNYYNATIAEITGLCVWTVMDAVGLTLKERIVINQDNFYEAMGDEDLEDLVADYMLIKNPDYVFLPSSCKKNTPGIEYVMYNRVSGESITCQTKVNQKIPISKYLTDNSFRKYKIIYLFSGIGYYGHDQNDLKNIHIIERDDLYSIFKSNKYFIDMVDKYFTIE